MGYCIEYEHNSDNSEYSELTRSNELEQQLRIYESIISKDIIKENGVLFETDGTMVEKWEGDAGGILRRRDYTKN